MNRSGQDRRLVALFACTVFGAVVVRTAWIADSAYVTFRVADNFIHGFGLRWNVAERVQVFTHPLWLAIVSACYAVTRDAYFTVLALSILLTIAAVFVVVTKIASSTASAVAAAAVLTLSKAFVDFTTSGFETPLTYALLALFWAVYVGAVAPRARSESLAALAGALVLTDVTAAVLVLPGLVGALWRSRSHGAWRAAAAGLAPVVAWEVFAFLYYGALLPNPTYARLYAEVPRSAHLRHGVVYLLDSINLDPLTLTAIGAAIALAMFEPDRDSPSRLQRRGPVQSIRPVAIGIALYVLLVVWLGGDAMSGRLLAPAVLCAAVLVSRVETESLTLAMRLQVLGAIVGLELMAPRPLTHVRRYKDSPRRYVSDLSGIADQRQLSYLGSGLMNARRDVPWPMEDDAPGGRTVRATQPGVAVSTHSGMQAFFAGPALHVIDPAAATDPVLARLPAKKSWQVGVEERAIPDGYEAIVGGSRATFTDPRVARLYAQMSIATRDPVWSWRRLGRLFTINFRRRPGGTPR
jgi:arabinofuranosyltransferase